MDEIVSPSRGDQLSDDQAMRLAMREARKGAGFVSPNPQVGCVIVDANNRFLAKGYHEQFGGPHAEINALKNLTEADLDGARLFVTLEPCAHDGKTPSCAKALVKLPLVEVIYGLEDPNPLVSGKGVEIIRQAGKKATLFGKWQEELEEVCEHFLTNFQQKRIFVSLKIAASLDGQMALKNGESKWITGEKAREYSHYLRAIHDVTLVGKNTILTDNPQLNIRHPQFHNKKNKIMVLDHQAKILSRSDLRIFHTHQPENLIIAADKDVKVQSQFAQILPCENLKDMLTKMWDKGIRSILVEGGAQTISSFIMAGLADRLYLFQAPMLLGANSGKSWSEGVNIGSMADKIQIFNPKINSLGVDWLITGKFKQGNKQ